MKSTPGTVSKILWHFTGGAAWNKKKDEPGKRKKTYVKAYEILNAI
jgi:hypothetical protein